MRVHQETRGGREPRCPKQCCENIKFERRTTTQKKSEGTTQAHDNSTHKYNPLLDKWVNPGSKRTLPPLSMIMTSSIHAPSAIRPAKLAFHQDSPFVYPLSLTLGAKHLGESGETPLSPRACKIGYLIAKATSHRLQHPTQPVRSSISFIKQKRAQPKRKKVKSQAKI